MLIGIVLCATYLASGATRIAARSTLVSAPVIQVASVPLPPKPQADPEPAAPAPVEESPRPPKSVPSGTYLQMAAVDRGVAEVFVEVLSRKGFQAVMANGPTEDMFRVLVGPVKDAASLVRVKADLQAAGFTSFARKLITE